jgi:5-hydroxyisourate hydrolase
VLDTSAGRPAGGVKVRLEVHTPKSGWVVLADTTTDSDGRAKDLVPAGSAVDRGLYRITFGVWDYFHARGIKTFFPEATVVFEVDDPEQHFHVPLLVSPFGYSTYRGS